jgi:hypothetical protein
MIEREQLALDIADANSFLGIFQHDEYCAVMLICIEECHRLFPISEYESYLLVVLVQMSLHGVSWTVVEVSTSQAGSRPQCDFAHHFAAFLVALSPNRIQSSH